MKNSLILMLLLTSATLSPAAQSSDVVYVYGEQNTPEAATAKVSQLLNGNVDEKLEAMNVLLASQSKIDAAVFLPKIREIAIEQTPYPAVDNLLTELKNQGKVSPVTLSAAQKAEVNRQNLQTLAICVMSIASPGSEKPILEKLSASGSPSLELIAKSVPQFLAHINKTSDDGSNLIAENGGKLSGSLNSIYAGAIPYTKEIGDILIKKYQEGALSFQDKAILLSILKLNKYEGVEEVIESLSKSENTEDRELPIIITDLTKNR